MPEARRVSNRSPKTTNPETTKPGALLLRPHRIGLTDSDYSAARALAAKRGISVSELIRDALRRELEAADKQRRAANEADKAAKGGGSVKRSGASWED